MKRLYAFRRILLIEDDANDIELAQAALRRRFGCHISVAATPEQFASELHQAIPDVIVSDSNVAHFPGVSAIRFATENCPGVPVVICSSNNLAQKHAEAKAAGAMCWVTKEHTYAALISEIERLWD